MLRRLFVENLGLKVLALAMAAMLVVVKRREEQSQSTSVTVAVHVAYPDHLVLVTPPVDKVSVIIEGKYGRLKDLKPDQLPPLDITLSGGEHDEQVPFEPEMFKVPPELEVRSVRPTAMMVRFEPKKRREVAVRAHTEGEPQSGYRLTETAVEPPRVMIEGAASVIDGLELIETEPISLVGRNQTTTLSAAVANPPAYTWFVDEAPRVLARVTIEEQQGTKLFADRPIQVRPVTEEEAAFEVSPATVSVSLSGPVRLLEALDPETMVPYVDAAEIPAGRKQLHTRRVRLDPPQGLALTELKPEKVTLVRVEPPPPPVVDAGLAATDAAADVPAP